MSPAHVLEPTYRRLKRAITDGTWPGGTKLEAQRLADEYGVSMTPVRDSLNQLAGEGLVDLTPGEGFRVAALTEKGLRDMLDVNAMLLEQANPPRSAPPSGPPEMERDAGYALRLATAFSVLASGTDNRFLVRLVEHVNDRVQAVRQIEPEIISNAHEMLAEIEASLVSPGAKRRAIIASYHRQCRVVVPQLIARLHR